MQLPDVCADLGGGVRESGPPSLPPWKFQIILPSKFRQNMHRNPPPTNLGPQERKKKLHTRIPVQCSLFLFRAINVFVQYRRLLIYSRSHVNVNHFICTVRVIYLHPHHYICVCIHVRDERITL